MKEKDKYKYYTLDKKEIKKQKVTKIASITLTVFFVLLGLILALVGLILNGWDFVAFFKDPKFSLICLLSIIIGIVLFAFFVFKKGNNGYGR